MSQKKVRKTRKPACEVEKFRGGWCDACAIRKLQIVGDFQIRQMVDVAVKEGETLTFGHGH